MTETRPTKANPVLLWAALFAVVGIAVWKAPEANWDPALFGILLGFSIFSDLTAIETSSKLKTSGSFLALVLAMVFLGGPPAAIIGVISIGLGWFRWHDDAHDLLVNTVTYATFPMVSGLAFHQAVERADVSAAEPMFYVLVFATFLLALALNFSMIAADALSASGAPPSSPGCGPRSSRCCPRSSRRR